MNRIKRLLGPFLLVLTDAAALGFSYLLAYALRSYLLVPLIPSFAKIDPLPLSVLFKSGMIYGLPVVVAVLAYEKLYTKRLSFWEEARRLLQSLLISFVLIMVLVFISRSRGYLQFSRAVILMAAATALIIFPLFRLGMKTLLARLGIWRKAVIILGTNPTARQAARGLRKDAMLGYDVKGFLREEAGAPEADLDGFPVLGGVAELNAVCGRFAVRDVIIALPDTSQDRLIEVIESCEDFAETIRIVPNIGSLFNLGVAVEGLGDVLSLSVARNLIKPWNRVLKTVFDYFFATLAALLILPVFLIVAAAIRIDSRGPVIFVQERLGRRGRVFKFYKFRSMHRDNEARLARFLKENPSVQREWDAYQKIKGPDPRVTRVGRFIRRYSLDEIPQLINVLKGDMSLVGPRPYLGREMGEIGKSYPLISRVKPGLTGLWQTSGRNLLTFRERLILDEHYIRNWSLWLDITILLRTGRAVARREGAF